jgi:hypothetical protein
MLLPCSICSSSTSRVRAARSSSSSKKKKKKKHAHPLPHVVHPAGVLRWGARPRRIRLLREDAALLQHLPMLGREHHVLARRVLLPHQDEDMSHQDEDMMSHQDEDMMSHHQDGGSGAAPQAAVAAAAAVVRCEDMSHRLRKLDPDGSIFGNSSDEEQQQSERPRPPPPPPAARKGTPRLREELDSPAEAAPGGEGPYHTNTYAARGSGSPKITREAMG